MHGVTTAIVGFIFACVVWPQLVRNRPQFHAGLVLAVLIILVDAIGYIASASPALVSLAYGLCALLQIGAILTLFFSAGGITPRELLGGVRSAYEVMRRGEEEKEVIIPLSGQQPAAAAPADDDEEGRVVFEINDPPAARPTPAAPPPQKKPQDPGPLPLD